MTTTYQDSKPQTLAWRDCPRIHTYAQSIAAKLRGLADALDQLGGIEISPTWLSIGIQVTGDRFPAERRATVYLLAEALGLGQATQSDRGQLGTTDALGVNVYTASVPAACCAHCTADTP